MANQDFLLALAAAIIGLSALLFAVFQAAAAFSQLMSSRSRCGRRVTGAFDLRAGIWLSMMSLTPNVKYRMPVLTMPGLRSRIPVMGPSSIPVEFSPGLNFKENAYIDKESARVFGTPPPKGPVGHQWRIDYPRTALTILRNVLWAPFAAVISLVALVACWPVLLFCAGCGACGGGGAAITVVVGPFLPLLTNIKRKKGSSDIERNIDSSPNTDLEPASWAQFLLVHQLAWWGHASIRWEWRLASTIPADVPGATIETTIADIQLLAVMFGMVPGDGQRVLARSACGEEILLTQHPIMGRLAIYRSGRENIKKTIWATTPQSASQWLHLCVEAAQMKRSNFPKPEMTFPTILGEKGVAIPSDHVSDILKVFSRRRTIFDAQLQFSCGDAMWVFSDHRFLNCLNGIWDFEAPLWEPVTVTVYIGPVGSGVNSCSCINCCKAWFISNDVGECQWPTLLIKRRGKGHIFVGEQPDAVLPVNVTVDTQGLCWAGCATHCTCGIVARAPQRQDNLSLEKSIAIVAINTDWLSKVEDDTLQQASESLLLDLADSPGSAGVRNVSYVMAYTEIMLLDVRKQIGSTNMWNTEVREFMSDFSPIAMG